jgi:hypothetical protein
MEPFIITSGIIPPGEITTQLISSKAKGLAVKYIKELSQHDTKVSEAKMTNSEKNYAVKLVKMSSYFEDEKNQHNELVRKEKLALIENGYDPWEDYYLAVPYPFAATADGMVFLFIKAKEIEVVEEKLPLFCKKIEVIFSSENL